MKKIAFGLLVFLSNLSIAQENSDVKKETKFQVGVHYVGNLRNENIISDGFNGVVGISGNYALYQDEMISVFGGLNIDYLQTRDYFLQNDILIWNPNASIEFDVFKGKLKPFFGFGYAFFSNEFKFETSSFDPSDPSFITRTTKLNFNGLTINPGLKYHVSDLLFIEGSYKYFPINSSDIDGKANTHFIYLGLGFKF
ncbi:outer membrane beta-barrel protein [Flavobacterium sp.]|uniref:outer membrane beta-barrel protein n=1 Tax=Flavobacterium sp. TaxID=239 RepID=UPI004048017A